MRGAAQAVAAVALLWAGAASAQVPGSSKCIDRCSDQMTACAPKCGNDQSCASRCMQRMDQCTKKCVETQQVGPTGQESMGKGKKCQNARGKMVPCEETGQFKTGPSRKKARELADQEEAASEKEQERERERLLKDPDAPRYPSGGE